MNRYNRNTKIFVIAVLVVVVIGLSIGFAAFTSALIIKSSATVNTDQNTFQVKFSTSQSTTTGGTVTGSPSSGASTTGTASISGTTISGLNAKFTKPNQSVTYTFYVRNDGQFVAYLNSITYASAITCTAGQGTNNTLVQAACKDMQVTVTVGEGDGKIATATATNADIDNHSLAKATGEKVVVKIEYKNSSNYADGDFTVNIANITLNYGTQD